MIQIFILILTKSGKPEINKLKIKLSVSDGLKQNCVATAAYI